MLVPVMGLTDTYFMKYSLVADHYAHLAMIGVITLAAAGWAHWQPRAVAPREAAAGTAGRHSRQPRVAGSPDRRRGDRRRPGLPHLAAERDLSR